MNKSRCQAAEKLELPAVFSEKVDKSLNADLIIRNQQDTVNEKSVH